MTPWVTRLIIVNVVMFFLSMTVPAATTGLMFMPALVLSRPWTLLTYMFLHADFWHLLLNMLGLFFFGPRLESELGGQRFLTLYFLSGIMGALLSFLTPFSWIIGASGAVYGVLLGFAYLWPREPIYLWGILAVEARWLVVGLTLISLLGGFGGGGGIAHFAHLGGFVGGYLCMRWFERSTRAAKFQAQFEQPPVRSGDIERWKKIPRESLHEVNRAELDRIMGKINAKGVEALTPEEKTFLDRFSPE